MPSTEMVRKLAFLQGKINVFQDINDVASQLIMAPFKVAIIETDRPGGCLDDVGVEFSHICMLVT